MRRRGAQPLFWQRSRQCRGPVATARAGVGFTLLEMIVVLAILGLATALVAPSMLRGIDSWRRQAALDAVLDQIRALPGGARGSGRAITIDDATLKGSRPPLRVPGEWTLGAPVGWKVNANGVCEGGEMTLSNAQGMRRIRVSAPFCDPVIE